MPKQPDFNKPKLVKSSHFNLSKPVSRVLMPLDGALGSRLLVTKQKHTITPMTPNAILANKRKTWIEDEASRPAIHMPYPASNDDELGE